MRPSNVYQILLILAGLIVTVLFGVFFYRELFPEYKIYQKDYIALEKFRSIYTHEPPPNFPIEIKQIVLEREDKGPPVIDRCTSCHVALQIPYFSPTKIAHDVNGQILHDEKGIPIQVPNEDYIWAKLDQKIQELRDPQVLEQLEKEGDSREAKDRSKQADTYEALKTAKVGDLTYDVAKVLAMHPLMGKETRPFEFHPIEEYGCTVCHNGNGRGLTTQKAHGPVFDDQYEVEFEGIKPQFTESDPQNDPSFARIFNHKPSHELLFQTQPIFVGSLLQAKCMQCHQTSEIQLEHASFTASEVTQKREKRSNGLKEDVKKDKEALINLLHLKQGLQKEGFLKTVAYLKQIKKDYFRSNQELESIAAQLIFLEKAANQQEEERAKQQAVEAINQQLVVLLGSDRLVDEIQTAYDQKGKESVDSFLADHRKNLDAKGVLFTKLDALQYEQDILRHIQDTQSSFETAVKDQTVISSLDSDVDELTRNYQRGKELYFSQACYACHRIAGLARGGVGPELTRSGESYPWFLKESIVWPQADLKTSTMPNMRLDHEEVQDLMTFLLAQKGSNKAVAQRSYQAALQSWEGGRKLSFEKPISPAQMYDLRYSMTAFAIEGCASCHRLQGFDSTVGFKIEKDPHSFEQLNEEQEWFRKLFPETIRLAQYDQPLPGSQIVERIEKHAKEIDERIVSNVRENGILEEIESKHPGAIEALYSEFKYALRAKDHFYQIQMQEERDPIRLAGLKSDYQAWKDRVHRVLMMYIQTYGLGRLIGPHPNWSGIYRTDEWLMQHFRNPTSHVPRSIMPVMPFDDTKFYALTYMLDKLGIINRQAIRAIWENRGFDPAQAFEFHCAQCHGQNLTGNGVVAEWIYPLPKSLRNSDFLHNLTKERAFYSIKHGVKGTPMPSWGEIGHDKQADVQKQIGNHPILTDVEISHLVDWLFSSLPGGEVVRQPHDVLKWNYTPKDILEELRKEGGYLIPLPPHEEQKKEEKLPEMELPEENNPPVEPQLNALFPTCEGYYASIRPEIYPKQSPDGVQQINRVEDVFDIVSHSTDPDNPYSYYIKEKYYTPYNLQEGRKFFLLNCASCHGNEGDGSGLRSQAMREAKPRMLTNLDWIHSRDDLRLIRSIKYGVPGTSMTPWGDLTNSLQRMQLVMFIRTLSKEQGRRMELASRLYQAFDQDQLTIDQARVEWTKALEEAQQKKYDLERQRIRIESDIEEGKEDPAKAAQTYQTLLKIDQEIAYLQEQDQFLQELKLDLRNEKNLYQGLGISLITRQANEKILNHFYDLVDLNHPLYALEKGKLIFVMNPERIKQIRLLRDQITQQLDKHIKELEQKLKPLKEKNEPAAAELITAIESELEGYKKLSAHLITETEETIRLIDKQRKTLQAFDAQRRT